MIGHKNADKITNVFKNISQEKSETVTDEEENVGLDREISRKRLLYPKKVKKLLMI